MLRLRAETASKYAFEAADEPMGNVAKCVPGALNAMRREAPNFPVNQKFGPGQLDILIGR
jgi:hypothetical protein